MSSCSILRSYRSLGRLIKRLPHKSTNPSYQPENIWRQLRTAFREPIAVGESVEERLEKANERLSFLKMIVPSASATTGTGGRWVYKDGKRVEGGSAKIRDANGRVISNWDGKNLDPDSVKQHNYQLRRMGYRNNAHAKGIF